MTMTDQNDEDRGILRDSVARLMTDHYGFRDRARHAASPEGWSLAMWDRYAELGLPAIGLPEAHGGIGGPIVDGKLSWDWEHYFLIADAMRDAAAELGVPMVWGGVWDKRLHTLSNTKAAVDSYVASRRQAGRKAFIDGPHFELSREVYPA